MGSRLSHDLVSMVFPSHVPVIMYNVVSILILLEYFNNVSKVNIYSLESKVSMGRRVTRFTYRLTEENSPINL